MSGSIKAIDASSVHQITSGQVIVDLQTAVKELVENSLDAGATNIDVRFKEYGTQSFEVLDNGSGIEAENYATVALKSHTSKLSSYEGLMDVTSFGFRGEALSSLCQLAEVTITTATEKDVPKGTILTFDRGGKLLSSSAKTARPRGTTVTVANLFAGVPVRRKEFERNNKKHFGQAQTLVQAYGLISAGARISLSNQQHKKPLQQMFKTDGKSIRENYAILFTAKAALTLLDFSLSLTIQAEKRNHKSIALSESSTAITVKGLISKPIPGSGRTSTDRQFYYINGRPFEAKSIAKAFNEVYKNHVPNHYPSVIADFLLPTDSYDVNVSPDKRSIFLHSERNLIEALKEALEELFQPFRSTYNADAGNLTRTGRLAASSSTQTKSSEPKTERQTPMPSRSRTPQAEETEETEQEIRSRSRTVDSANIDNDEEMPLFRQGSEEAEVSQGNGMLTEDHADQAMDLSRLSFSPAPISPEDEDLASRKRRRTRSNSSDGTGQQPEAPRKGRPQVYQPVMQMTLDTNGASWNLQPASASDLGRKRARVGTMSKTTSQLGLEHFRLFAASGNAAQTAISEVEDDEHKEMDGGSDDDEEEEALLDDEAEDREIAQAGPPNSRPASRASHSQTLNDDIGEDPNKVVGESSTTRESIGPTDDFRDSPIQPVSPEDVPMIRTDSRKVQENETEGTLSMDLPKVRKRWQARRSRQLNGEDRDIADKATEQGNLEGAGIEHKSEEAEQTLSRLVSKADFSQMEIVGQFNLAFIIARRRQAIEGKGKGRDNSVPGHQDDLMIIDQHASDEKYNFERLQQVTKIESQRLLRPRDLNLTASDELLAIEHQDVLRFNGFEIETDEDAPAGQRIKLMSMPSSKATKKTEFTLQDLEELLFLLREHTGSGMLRPSKTRKLFAMLACRSSVMVGKTLSLSQMTNIVRHMGTMDQPWNCPHGRNTMRWLRGLEGRKADSRFSISSDSFSRLLESDTPSQSQSLSQSQ